MSKDNHFLNDVTKFTKSAFTGMANIKRDLGSFISHYVEEIIARMRFVKRDEFEVLKKMVVKLKKELDTLKSIDPEINQDPVTKEKSKSIAKKSKQNIKEKV